MLALVVVIAVIIALMRGGHLGNLSHLPLRKIGWFILAFIIQIGLYLLTGEKTFIGKYGPLIHILSYVFIIIGLERNWEIKEIKIISVGIFLNFLVIVLNGGRMPALINTPNLSRLSLNKLNSLADGSDPRHCLYNNSTRLGFLSDIFSLPAFFPYSVIFSIGDLIASIGAFLLIQKVMLAQKVPHLTRRGFKR